MEILLRQLAEATAAGNREIAEALVCTLVDDYADDSMAHITAAQVYNWLGRKEQCYLHAAIALALSPDTPAPYSFLAILASKTISRRTLQRILENGWERKSHLLPKRLHKHEREDDFRSFYEKHKPPVK